MDKDLESFVALVNTWRLQRTEVFKRQEYGDGSNASSLREFVDIQTGVCRRMISLVQEQDPDFWSAMFELANHAQTVVKGAKTFVNGQDVTFETGGQ